MSETAIFAAGCFWGIEAAFRKVNGVIKTQVGYCGGEFENPTYDDVCSGTTGHAESVRVEYDPAILSYNDLLNVFWQIHDPTSLNRQGPDIGSQYRSAIFYHNETQRMAALDSIENFTRSGKFKRRIVTQVIPTGKFYPAEEYHQCYYEKQNRPR